MYDFVESINAGEARPVYFEASAEVGTLAIAPTPKITITDNAGTIIVNAVAPTGYDSGAMTSPRVWHNVDSRALTMVTGQYTVTCEWAAQGTDAGGNNEGFTRRYVRHCRLVVNA